MKCFGNALRVALAAVVPLASTPVSAQANCCGETFRLECQTVWEERQVTAFRMEQETVYDQVQVTRKVPVWETEQRERRFTVSKPVQETSVREERFIVHKAYASHKHLSKGRARKRRTISIYAEKDPYA